LIAVKEIKEQLPSNIVLYQYNDDINLPVFSDSKDLQTLMSQVPRDPPSPSSYKKPGHHDQLVYIYTSGTTGLPKAAVITHNRYIYIAAAIHRVAGFKENDTFYSPLPLYHTACGCMSVGQMIIFGSTVVLRKKFSASAYFADCAKYKATVSGLTEKLDSVYNMFLIHSRLLNILARCVAIASQHPVN
jgi:solute carrier family 27 (fatty acid transporter), member 1/4